MRPVINSNKHYVQVSLATILAGVRLNTFIANAVDAPLANSAGEVRQGAVIKAVYVEMWVRTNDTSPGTALLSIVKTSGNAVAPTFVEHIALHTYAGKKNVLYHTQGLTNDQDADAIPFLRAWVKIPKSKQRFGLGDSLVLTISAQALDQNICGFMTYKEYF